MPDSSSPSPTLAAIGLVAQTTNASEFLGDAVLDLIVAEIFVCKILPKANEGALDRCRASIVNGKSLARAASAKCLGEYLEGR